MGRRGIADANDGVVGGLREGVVGRRSKSELTCEELLVGGEVCWASVGQRRKAAVATKRHKLTIMTTPPCFNTSLDLSSYRVLLKTTATVGV